MDLKLIYTSILLSGLSSATETSRSETQRVIQYASHFARRRSLNTEPDGLVETGLNGNTSRLAKSRARVFLRVVNAMTARCAILVITIDADIAKAAQ